MKISTNEYNIELNLFDYFQYYQYFRNKLIDKKYDLNSENIMKKSFMSSRFKEIHTNFKIFTHKLLSESLKTKQSNNHFFLRTLLGEKHEDYLRVSYSALYQKIEKTSLKDIKVGNKNIGAKNIFSNKILSNETEHNLKVSTLETEFLNFVRKQDIQKLQPNFLLDIENETIYINTEKQNKFTTNIKDYFALQIVRNEGLFLNLISIFEQYIDFKEFSFFDYLFFKYIYNYSIKIHFKNMQKKVNDFNYVKIQNYLQPDFTPLNFCMNEFNTIRLSSFKTIPEYNEFFNEEDYKYLGDIFITVGKSNSFVFLSKKPINDILQDKIDNFLRSAWNITSLASTLRTFLVPINSQFLDIRFYQNQLNTEDYNRTILLEFLFEKMDIYEDKIELLLSP